VAVARHSVDRNDGVTISRDFTKEAPNWESGKSGCIHGRTFL
jgi:hypothetical protein